MVDKVSGGSHQADHHVDDNKASGDKKSGGSNAGSNSANGGSVANEVIHAGTFQAQIAELQRISNEAMAKDIELRIVSTQLQTEKKAADERVQ
ncbi:nodulation protein NopA [Bradyrhizobium sp. UFLA05-153]